jgi:hypothetical protein
MVKQRTRPGPFPSAVLLLTAFLLCAESVPVSAMAAPSIMMIYGDSMQTPIFAITRRVPEDIEKYAFLTCAKSQREPVKGYGQPSVS